MEVEVYVFVIEKKKSEVFLKIEDFLMGLLIVFDLMMRGDGVEEDEVE